MKNAMSILFAVAVIFPTWMAGSWTGDAEGVQMEEHWTTASGGVMLGMHRDVGKKTSFEFLRIEQGKDGTLVYQAQPDGRAATPFRMESVDDKRVVFENAKHDFPQRIIYWRNGEKLCGRVEGTIGGKSESEEWCWSRAK